MRRGLRRRAYAPTSNTASHFYNEKIFMGFYEYGTPLAGSLGHRSTDITSLLITFERTGNAKTVLRI